MRSVLDVPTFATREHSAAEGETVGEKCPGICHVTFRDLVKLRHGTDGFTSPPKEGVLRIFPP